MIDDKQQVHLTEEAFFKRIREMTTVGKPATVVRNVLVDGCKNPIRFQEFGIERLVLDNCFLEDASFLGRTGAWTHTSETGLALSRYVGDSLHISERIDVVQLDSCTLRHFTIDAHAKVKTLRLHGTVKNAVLHVSELTSIQWAGFHADTLMIVGSPAACSSERCHAIIGSDTLPLTIGKVAYVEDACWARWLRLLCPTTPIVYTGPIEKL